MSPRLFPTDTNGPRIESTIESPIRFGGHTRHSVGSDLLGEYRPFNSRYNFIGGLQQKFKHQAYKALNYLKYKLLVSFAVLT